MTSARFQVNAPLVVHEAFEDGEVVVINLKTGSYFSFERAAADVWSMVARSASIAEIADALAGRYDAPRAEIENATGAFLATLQALELVVPAAGAPAAPNGDVGLRPLDPKIPFEAPRVEGYNDMQELLLLDPIHEVEQEGWPNRKQDAVN